MAIPSPPLLVTVIRTAVAWCLAGLLLLVCATPALAVAPTVSDLPASGVVDTAAVINATVNPHGIDTTYFFEYTTDAAYQLAPGTYQTPVSGGDAGTGSSARDVAAQLNGLQANTTYHFRVDASNGVDQVLGPDQTFTTAAAPQPPAIASVQAGAIADTTATVSGSVNPEGRATNYYLEYGPSSSYGTSVPVTPPSVGSGSLPQNVAVSLTNLAPHSTYHYALVASNGTDTVTSTDQTFTTTTPPSASTGTASAVTGASATVNGTANVNSDPSTVYFQYGPTVAYGRSTLGQSTQASTTQPFSATLSSLATGTPYHFRIVAVNGPDITYGADQTFTTLAPPTLGSGSPQFPTDTTALLNATIDPSGQNTQYYVNWGTDTSYSSGSTPVTTLPQANGTQPVQISLAGLTADTTYHFALVATNSAGTTTGPDQVFTTPMPPGVSPSPPTTITDTGATLAGSVTTHGFATTYHYEYASAGEYASSTSYPHTTPPQPAADGVTESATISQLTPGTLYHYALVASNGTDTVTSTDQTFTTSPQPPPAAGTTGSENVTDNTATLRGLVNPRGYPTTYQFQYGTSTSFGSMTPPQSARSGSATIDVSASLSGLVRGTTYYFRTVATNSAGSAYGDTQSFTTTTPPSATTGSASAITGTSASASGTANANGDPSTVYFQYGPTTAYGSATLGQTVSGTADQPVSAVLGGLSPGTTYHFRLVAVNGPDTTWGTDQTLSTLARPVVSWSMSTPTGDTAVTLSGTINPSAQTTSYYFNYGTSSAYGSTTAPQTLPGTNGSQVVRVPVSGLAAGTVYHFQLVASNSAGTTSGADQVFTTPPPPAVSTSSPTMITDTGATLQGSVAANGFLANYHFEYASADEYGSSGQAGTYPHLTASRSVGSVTGDQPESAILYQLAPATVYHFRLVVNEGAETFVSTDQAFSTAPAPPPMAGTTGSLNVGDSTATLSGLIDPRGYPTNYQFQYGTSTSYGSITAPLSAGSGTATLDVSASLTGLARGTTYYFRAVATSSAGTTYGGAQTFTTTAGVPVAVEATAGHSPSATGAGGTSLTAPSVAASGPAWTTRQPNGVAILDPGLSVSCPLSLRPCHVAVAVTTVLRTQAVRAGGRRHPHHGRARIAILGTAAVTVLPGHTARTPVILSHTALTMLRASRKLSALVRVTLPGGRSLRVRPVLVLMPR